MPLSGNSGIRVQSTKLQRAMPTIFWDIETRSTLALETAGAWRYAADPTRMFCASAPQSVTPSRKSGCRENQSRRLSSPLPAIPAGPSSLITTHSSARSPRASDAALRLAANSDRATALQHDAGTGQRAAGWAGQGRRSARPRDPEGRRRLQADEEDVATAAQAKTRRPR